MVKKSKEIVVITILYFISAIFNVFIGISDKSNIAFLAIGFILAVLGFGLYKLWNLTRVISVTTSLFFILIYTLLLIGTFMGKFEGWGGMGLLANFPVLLLSLYTIDLLLRSHIKCQFKK